MHSTFGTIARNLGWQKLQEPKMSFEILRRRRSMTVARTGKLSELTIIIVAVVYSNAWA